MDKLVDVKEGVRVGIRPDEVYSDETVWADGRNVVFSSGSVRPTLSQSYFIAQGTKRPVTCIQEALIDGVKHLFWGSQKSLYHYAENTEVAIANLFGVSDYGLTRRQLWSMTNWKSTVVVTGDATVGTQAYPQYWDDVSGLFVAINLAGAPFGLAEIVAITSL